MRGRYKPKVNNNYEFDLDLAPLLAVMVKLVPVLLVSAAFVQVMVVETDLPQVVKEAIERESDPNAQRKVTVGVSITRKDGFKVTVLAGGEQKVEQIANLADGTLNFEVLHKSLQRIKTEYPETFRIELSPEAAISYKEVVRVMDFARKSRDKDIKFAVIDQKQNKEVITDFMFPDVVFANMLE